MATYSTDLFKPITFEQQQRARLRAERKTKRELQMIRDRLDRYPRTIRTDQDADYADDMEGQDATGGGGGEPGPPGPPNELEVGTVTTGAPGSNATVTITGESPEQIINFGIPRGNTGTPGTPGTPGSPGAAGPPNVLSIGTVGTVAPGGDATASITGTSPAQVLNLGIPRGDKGDKGDKGDPGSGGGAATALLKASYVRAGALAIPASSATPVVFDTALYPAVGITYNATTGLFTVPAAGTYVVFANLSWANEAGGLYRQIRLMKNGAITDVRNIPVPSGVYINSQVVRTIALAAGDTIAVQAYSSGLATSLQPDAVRTATACEIYSIDASPPLSTAAPGRELTGWTTTADFTPSGALALNHPYQVDKHVVWNIGGICNAALITSANGQLTPAVTIATITDPAARPRVHNTFTWSNGSTVWGTGIINATDGTVTLQTCNRLSLNAGGGQGIRLAAAWVTATSPVPVAPPLVTSTWGQGNLIPANVGTDSLVGGQTYIDANGQIRTLPQPVSGLVAPYQTGNFIDTTKGSGSGGPWTISSGGVRLIRYGPIVQMYWNMSPASDLNSSPSGNIGNIVVGQLANGAPPPLMAGHMWHGTFSGGGSVPVGGISTSGNVTLGTMAPAAPNTGWAAGEGRDFGCMYFAALDAP